jgi:hypothetical protein
MILRILQRLLILLRTHQLLNQILSQIPSQSLNQILQILQRLLSLLILRIQVLVGTGG